MSEIVSVVPDIPVVNFDDMSDRELMLYIAESHQKILSDINDVKDQIMPMVESLASSPILRPFFGGK